MSLDNSWLVCTCFVLFFFIYEIKACSCITQLIYYLWLHFISFRPEVSTLCWAKETVHGPTLTLNTSAYWPCVLLLSPFDRHVHAVPLSLAPDNGVPVVQPGPTLCGRDRAAPAGAAAPDLGKLLKHCFTLSHTQSWIREYVHTYALILYYLQWMRWGTISTVPAL